MKRYMGNPREAHNFMLGAYTASLRKMTVEEIKALPMPPKNWQLAELHKHLRNRPEKPKPIGFWEILDADELGNVSTG